MSPRSDLISKASQYSDDIGTADYLVDRFMGESGNAKLVMPGQLINWVIRMQPQSLRAKIDEFEKLAAQYEYVGKPSTVDSLKDNWTGQGGGDFQRRYAQLDAYVIGEGANPSGRATKVTEQATAMRTICTNMETFQKECGDAIDNNLAGFRQKYIEAVVSEGDKSTEAIITAMVDVGAGAFGTAVGGISGAGGLVKSVVGLIFTFANENAASADKMLDDLGADTAETFRLLQKDIEYTIDGVDPDNYREKDYDPDIDNAELTDDDPWT